MAKKPAKSKNGKGSAQAEAAAGQEGAPEDAKFAVLVQFIKDMSFESPTSPMSLQSPGENPKLEINVQVQIYKHAPELFEVDLMLEAKAESDIGVIYNIELVYGAMFQAANIPDEYINGVLFVDAPTVMFPFMRRVIADVTRDGGFQPLMLDPIDFNGLYQANSDKAVIQDLTANA